MKVLRQHPGPVIGVTAFALLSLLLTALVAGTLSNSRSGATLRIDAVFRDATGVAAGDDVRMAGVRVGRVVDTHLEDNLAVVTLEVDAGQDVTSTTRAGIDYLNLMGQRYISLERGPGGDTGPLDDGDTIPVGQTHGALDLTAMFNAFKPLFETLRPAEVNELAGNLVGVLQGQGGTLRHLTRQTARLTGTIVTKDKVIGQVIDNLTTVAETANGHRQEIVRLVDELRGLTKGLARDRSRISAALVGLQGAVTTGRELVTTVGDPVRRSVQAMRGLTSYFSTEDDLVASTLENTPLQLDTYLRTLGYGSHLNVYVCQLYLQVRGGPGVDLPPTKKSTERCR